MSRSTAQLHVLLLALPLLWSTACRTVKVGTPEAKLQEAERRAAAAAAPGIAAAVVDAQLGMNRALDAAMSRAVGWRTLDPDLPWRVIIDTNRVPIGSFSAGTVADGVLLDGAELPVKGEFHSIIERHQRNQTRWGTSELVDLIQRAAQHVYISEPGAPLRVGNMSAKKGGDIRWSRSHNSGRDADLAFYVVAFESNESVVAPDLLSFNDQGVPRGREDLRFDVARNWRLVEGLLDQTEINVQWLFISIPLKQALLDHGRSIGAKPEVLRRAAEVLHQPTDAPPHADHFHLRIGCSKDDRIDGCLDYGPQWDWLDWHQRALLSRSLHVAESFAEGTSADKKRALEFLGEIKSPFAADVAGVWGFWDRDAAIRAAALQVADDQYGWSANALVQVQKLITTGDASARELRMAYAILRRSRDPLSRDFALQRLADTAAPPAERALAAGALGHFMDPEIVPPLIAALADAAPDVRESAADVLRRVTNRTDGIDWRRTSTKGAADAQAEWMAWWQSNQNTPRKLLLAQGFRAFGVKVDGELDAQHIDALLKLLESRESFVRYNANRSIRELTGRWAPLEQEDGRALTKYWEPWWKKNRDRVLSGEIGGDS